MFHIKRLPKEYQDTYKAALLSTVSEAVNTVGKQFAQPIRPRLSSGLPKPNLGKSAKKDREISIHERFATWLTRYKSLESNSYRHHALRMDYADALDSLESDTAVIYADPPYTRDHYSRFYHVLETICLADNPMLSTSTINGSTRISRGLYRESRHQSPFCIKNQAIEAFEKIFKKSHNHGCSLVLSYSPYDESKKVHPRVVKMSSLTDLAKKYFSKVDVSSLGAFAHNKFNRAEKNLEASEQAEILIICQH